jgi:aquaporin Z
MLNNSVAEFLGTYIFLLVIIVTGNAWAIGLTLALVIYLLGNISGGNFNPAVTVMLVLAKKEPVSRLIPYVVAQLLGGVAALVTYKVLKTNKLLPK